MDYIDGKKGTRYLPEKIRKTLTTKEKAAENRRKKSCHQKKEFSALNITKLFSKKCKKYKFFFIYF